MRLIPRFVFPSAIFLLSAVWAFGSIELGGNLKDPQGLLLRFQKADSCVIVTTDFAKPAPASSERKSTQGTEDDSSFVVEDAAVMEAIVRQLSHMDLKPSSLCFCIGQPVLRFFRQNVYLGSVSVKHDEDIELTDASGHLGYFSGRAELARDFYAVLSPVIKRAREAADTAAPQKPRLGLVAEGQAANLKQAAVGEVKQQEDYVRQLPGPAIAVPVVVETGRRK